MKKFTFLAVAMLLTLATNVLATDFTLSSNAQITQEGITVTFAQSNGQNAPAWYDAGLRLYANNTITITSTEDIKEIVFNWEKQGNKAFATATANVGSYSHPTQAGTGTWTEGDAGSVKTVVFTIGSSGQLQLNTFSVTTGEIEDIPATGVVLSENAIEMEQYKRATLTATLTPAEATSKVEWTSSDETVVMVANGNLTAVGVGTAVITATAEEGVSATCNVTVTAPTILTCAAAAEIALAVSADNEVAEGGMYVIRGYVTEVFTNAADNLETYGNYSFWMADTKSDENVFEAYQVAPVNGTYLAAVGDYVEIVGDLTKYNTTPETVGKGASTVQKLSDPTTLVNSVVSEAKIVKTIENGQLVIIREGVKYNAQGVVIR